MKNRSKSDLPAKLARGCKRFEKWRSCHKPHTRLPEHLWFLAVELARDYGLSRTAGILRLDYNGLKKRVEFPVSDDVPPAKPQFLELLPAGPNSAIECSIECKDTHGAAIRIHLKGSQLPDLEALLHSFWKGHQ